MLAAGKSGRSQAQHTWESRPLLSFALRTIIAGVPALLAVAVVAALSEAVPRPQAVGLLVARWVVLGALGVLIAALAERFTRRWLPLAALLKVSLTFPDQAPARFALARTARRPAQVLEELHRLGRDSGDAEVRTAQKVLELTVALSVHDRATRGHSERVRVFTEMIARELGLLPEARARLNWAALLHDIGKLAVPERILNKPSKPTETEWQALRAHPAEGARLAEPVLPWLGVWGQAVLQHHEWFDGTGYPAGLSGEQISLGARIVSCADIFEVMTAPRPYKRPLSVPAARQELVRVAGTQLDPSVVRAFLNVSVGRQRSAVGGGALVAQLPIGEQVMTWLTRGAQPLLVPAAAAGTALAVVGPGLVHAHNDLRTPAASAPVTGAHQPQPTSSGANAAPADFGGTAGPPQPPSSSTPLPQPTTSKEGMATPTPSPSLQPSGGSASPTPTPLPTVTPTPTPTSSSLLGSTVNLLGNLLGGLGL